MVNEVLLETLGNLDLKKSDCKLNRGRLFESGFPDVFREIVIPDSADGILVSKYCVLWSYFCQFFELKSCFKCIMSWYRTCPGQIFYLLLDWHKSKLSLTEIFIHINILIFFLNKRLPNDHHSYICDTLNDAIFNFYIYHYLPYTLTLMKR